MTLDDYERGEVDLIPGLRRAGPLTISGRWGNDAAGSVQRLSIAVETYCGGRLYRQMSVFDQALVTVRMDGTGIDFVPLVAGRVVLAEWWRRAAFTIVASCVCAWRAVVGGRA